VVPGIVNVFEVLSFVVEVTKVRVVPALNQGDDRGLSTTRGSDKGDDVVLRNLKRDIVENRYIFLGRVGERDRVNRKYGIVTLSKVSRLLCTDGFDITRLVDNVSDGDTGSLDLAQVTKLIEHHANVPGKNLHVH